MIILFEVNEKSFTSLGLGILTDAIKCVVKEKLNDEFTLEMEYPVTGKHFSKILIDRILYCNPNPYDNAQAFRINNITKPINGIVVVNAVHLSYDLNNIPINAISGDNLQDLLSKIQNDSVIEHNFDFSSELVSAKTYKTTSPYNLRAILMGSENSIVSEYEAELKFNNFMISIMSKRGKSNGSIVRYGRNMIDINHEASSDSLYNGVFPFYHTETEKNETETNDDFTQVYIVGSKPLQDGWLSYSRDGQAYHPVDTSPVQIATEGDYYQKVYIWNETYHVYQEKLYNQTVTILQGILEPEWIIIDWSSFPNIICKASKKGYFKLSTDENWGSLKGVGDIIFEGSIATSGLMENMILYYSEVIPSKTQSENKEVTEIVDVQLDNKILWLDTPDAKSMKHNKILMLDLTSEFDEAPTKERLKAEAEIFIDKHKIGLIKHSTTVSFVDLSTTTEQSKYENFDHIEIGDTVNIIYEDAKISVYLRVITTEYDVISKRYSSIELGEKKDTMSSESVQSGDNVSALTNDVRYATVTTVNKLIADMVTANYIEAINAKLTQAQIKQLEVERINVKGIIEASQFTLDSLVAALLISENAEISNTLTAGKIKVAGDISVLSGQISINSEKEGTKFIVDREGNLTANSVRITGGILDINDGVFEVTNEGILTAKDALIRGHIEAITGTIAEFKIKGKDIYTNDVGTGIFISKGSDSTADIAGSSLISGWAFAAGNKFGVTSSGKLYAQEATISGNMNVTDGSIKIGYIDGTDPNQYNFTVDSNGKVIIKSGSIDIGDGIFNISDEGKVSASDIDITGGEIKITLVASYNPVSISSEQYYPYWYYTKNVDNEYNLSTGAYNSEEQYYEINNGTSFIVDPYGNLIANSVRITGGNLNINDNFIVSNNGIMSAKEAHVSGTIHIDSGEILLGFSDYDYIIVPLTIETYKPYIYYFYDDISEEYILDTSLDFTSGRIYYQINPIDEYGQYNVKFYVDNSGNMYATSAHIQGQVEITEGSIKIGYIEGTDPDQYNFTVDSNGKVSIVSGSINLGYDINNQTYAFEVTEEGSVHITSGYIILGDANGSGTYIDSDGNIKSGYNSYDDTYNLLILNDGSISIGGNAFRVSNSGFVSIYSGSLSVGENETLQLGECHIENISSCNYADISTILSSYINTNTIKANIEYIEQYLYFGPENTVRMGISESTQASQSVILEIKSYTPTTLFSSGTIQVVVGTVGDVVTKVNTTIEIIVEYKIHRMVNGIYDMRPGSRKSTISIPKGTSDISLVTQYLYFDMLSVSDQKITIDDVYIVTGEQQILSYYENTSSSLRILGSLVPYYINNTCTLGSNVTPWYRLWIYEGLYLTKPNTQYMSNNYLKLNFSELNKYEPSSSSPWFRIGQSSKTNDLSDYYLYSDTSLLSILSQGRLELHSYGPSSSNGHIWIESYNANIAIEASKHISLKMFGSSRNLNRRGLFIDFGNTTGTAQSLYAQTSSFWTGSEQSDSKGPWDLQVYFVSAISGVGSHAITCDSTVQAYAAMFQEAADGSNNYQRNFCMIEDINGGVKNRITVYNNSARTISGWLWVLFLRVH